MYRLLITGLGVAVLFGGLGASCVPVPSVGDSLPRETARIQSGESLPGVLATDLDADGLDELVLADISAGEFPRTEAGEVRVLERPIVSGNWAELPARLVLRGGQVYRHLGAGMVAADLDHDDTKDLVLTTDPGLDGLLHVYVVSGTLRGEHSESSAYLEITGPATLGQAMAGLDYNSDGIDDLVITCPVRSEVYVILGPQSGQLRLPEDADAVLSTQSGSLGWSLGKGDFDGDGRTDLAISEPVSDSIFLVHTGTLGTHAVQDAAWAVVRSTQPTDDLVGADVLVRTDAAAAGLVVRCRRTDLTQQGTVFIVNGPILGDVDLRSGSYMALNYTASVLGASAAWVPWGDAGSSRLAVGTPGRSQIPDSNLKGGLWLLGSETQGDIVLEPSSIQQRGGHYIRPQDVGLDWWGREVVAARLADPMQWQLLVSSQGGVVVFDQP